jgi:hypothetical protein
MLRHCVSIVTTNPNDEESRCMGILRFAWNMYELAKENDRIIEHLDMALEDGEQGKELRHSCSSPLAGWLILLDNDWERCEMDGIRVVLNRLPGATDEPLGIDHVCPGRHIVRTTLSSGVATLDTLLYPGDMLAFRLDRRPWGIRPRRKRSSFPSSAWWTRSGETDSCWMSSSSEKTAERE